MGSSRDRRPSRQEPPRGAATKKPQPTSKQKTHTHTLEVPRKIKPGRRVIHAACGHYHSLLVGAGGELLATGRGGDGQLGLPGRRNKETFTQVNSGAVFCRRVLSVAAGDTHSLALLGEGQVASWGWNGDEQLGRVIDDDDDEAPKTDPKSRHAIPMNASAGLSSRHLGEGGCSGAGEVRGGGRVRGNLHRSWGKALTSARV